MGQHRKQVSNVVSLLDYSSKTHGNSSIPSDRELGGCPITEKVGHGRLTLTHIAAAVVIYFPVFFFLRINVCLKA